ncbi:MAG: hypothetical protein U1D30_02630 [Planctomycetota bacterium]
MKRAILLGAIWAFSLPVSADDLPVVTADKQSAPKVVAPEIAKTLSPTSYSIKNGDKEIAHLWIRESIPVQAADEPPPYNAMTEGTLVAVLEIKADDLTDFRDQKLAEGIYTLRLGIQPSDGNHMGVAPFPEFLCLVPAEKDTELAPMEHDPLMKISKEASGTGHPAVMFMQPFFEKPALKFPIVNENEANNIVVNVLTHAEVDGKKIDFPIGIIIVGTTDAE